MPLRPYQDEGVTFLVDRENALLADEMGLGKTIQVAQALARLRSDGRLQRALIIAPSSLINNWQRELLEWGPDVLTRSTSGFDAEDRRAIYELPIPIVLTSYENLRADFLFNPPSIVFDAVVFDEAQRMKNPDADTAIAGRRVNAQRRWLVSATPLENGIEDVISLLRASGLRGLARDATANDVVEALQGNFLRRRKRDVLPQLPPIIDQTVVLQLTTKQRAEYSRVEHGVGHHSLNLTDVLAVITRLKQICNKSSDGDSAKLDFLRTILSDPGMGAMRVIVVSQYVATLHWLRSQLAGTVDTYLLTGENSQDMRENALARFAQSRCPCVLLLSLKAGGVGLNIPTASHVVLFDRWWNPATETQAIHRAHRFGRSEPLISYRLLVADTVEARIEEILERKARLFADVVDGRSPNELAEVNRLSMMELTEVLRGKVAARS